MTNPFEALKLEMKKVRNSLTKEHKDVIKASQKSLVYYTPEKKELYEAYLKTIPKIFSIEEPSSESPPVEENTSHKESTTTTKTTNINNTNIKEFQIENVISKNAPHRLSHLFGEEDSIQDLKKVLQYYQDTNKSLNELDELQITLLQYIIQKGWIKCLVHLLGMPKEIDIDMTDPEGNTALHFAVEKDDPCMVSLLLQCHAKTHLENERGQSPMSLSKENSACQSILSNEKSLKNFNTPITNTPITNTPTKNQDDDEKLDAKQEDENLVTDEKLDKKQKARDNFIKWMEAKKMQRILKDVVENAYDTLEEYKLNHQMLYESYLHDMQRMRTDNTKLAQQNKVLQKTIVDLMKTMKQAASRYEDEMSALQNKAINHQHEELRNGKVL